MTNETTTAMKELSDLTMVCKRWCCMDHVRQSAEEDEEAEVDYETRVHCDECPNCEGDGRVKLFDGLTEDCGKCGSRPKGSTCSYCNGTGKVLVKVHLDGPKGLLEIARKAGILVDGTTWPDIDDTPYTAIAFIDGLGEDGIYNSDAHADALDAAIDALLLAAKAKAGAV